MPQPTRNAHASGHPHDRDVPPAPAEAPLKYLLDLDAGRLPRLTVRLDDRDVRLREPESLALTEALRLGELLRTLAHDSTSPQQFDATAAEIVTLIAPQLAPPTEAATNDRASTVQAATRTSAPPADAIAKNPGIARRIVAFYAEHLARAVEALSDDGGAPPFSMPPTPASPAPASPPATASPSASNSPCQSPNGPAT